MPWRGVMFSNDPEGRAADGGAKKTKGAAGADFSGLSYSAGI